MLMNYKSLHFSCALLSPDFSLPIILIEVCLSFIRPKNLILTGRLFPDVSLASNLELPVPECSQCFAPYCKPSVFMSMKASLNYRP